MAASTRCLLLTHDNHAAVAVSVSEGTHKDAGVEELSENVVSLFRGHLFSSLTLRHALGQTTVSRNDWLFSNNHVQRRWYVTAF